MTLDQWLLIILGLALLTRYHRNELRKADERFDKCDKERVLLHNLYYQRMGADFQSGGEAEDQLIEQEPETPESRYKEAVQQMKLQLKRLARTRPEHLGPALRRVERQRRPSLAKIRPAMDPATADLAATQASTLFSDIAQKVANGRPTHNGG